MGLGDREKPLQRAEAERREQSRRRGREVCSYLWRRAAHLHLRLQSQTPPNNWRTAIHNTTHNTTEQRGGWGSELERERQRE